MNRHDLLQITDEGILAARKVAEPMNMNRSKDEIELAIQKKIPAILRRQEQKHINSVEVGFSSSVLVNGSRLRVAAMVPINCIEKVITPFCISKRIIRDIEKGFQYKYLSNKELELAKTTCELAEQNGLEAGFYGSFALQIMVEKEKYFNPESDIDVYVKPVSSKADLSNFYKELNTISENSKRKIDCEFEYKGYGIKLAELLSAQKTVLCKGLYNVKIMERSPIIHECM